MLRRQFLSMNCHSRVRTLDHGVKSKAVLTLDPMAKGKVRIGDIRGPHPLHQQDHQAEASNTY